MSKKSRSYSIGVDIGGTKMLTVLLDEHFQVRGSVKARIKVTKGEKYFFEMLTDQIRDVMEQKGISSKHVRVIGVGCPGMIDYPEGVVRLSPNLPFLKNCSLQQFLVKRFRCPVTVENDVNAGLYGEFRFGAAKGYDHVVGIFVGTGVGGALILNGKLYRGVSGGAGEIGHTFLMLGPSEFGLERAGTVENLTGRLTVASEAMLLALRKKAPHLFAATDSDVQKIKSGVLAKAIRQGDRALRDLIHHRARLLGVAMANAVNLINPELIVLGGGMVEALGSLIIPEARRAMKEYALAPLVKEVTVAEARLKDFAVAKGAAKLALERAEKAGKA